MQINAINRKGVNPTLDCSGFGGTTGSRPNTCSSTASPAGVASLQFECPGAVAVYTGAALLVVINQSPKEPTQLLPPSLGSSVKIKTIEMFQKLKKKKICTYKKFFLWAI